ncbi:MAG: NAD(P)/FAD-dependent oxidoreductase [Acidimicrobiales bacterium]
MRTMETDYLVIGAGASGMAFVDALVGASDADVVMVDRRHRPGGHWLDAYPFVRLHQPSANYGVASRTLGHDRIDEDGPNAGFYERASAGEICDNFTRVLEEDLVPSGRVRFLGMCDYQGAEGGVHHVASLLTGARTAITVRRKLVDATYIESSVPSRHTPAFGIDPGVRLIPPNGLVDLDQPPGGFTVLGGGKTAMDTCNWLLDEGVDPDRIRWIRPRDSWLFNRAFVQPLDLVASSYMQLQAHWVGAAAEAVSGTDFAHRLEARDVMLRLDPRVEPGVFRGATISERELDALSTIERVVRRQKVVRISNDKVILDGDEISSSADEVYVDCTAAGLPPSPPRAVFDGDRITLQYVTVGFAPWSAATVGVLEASTMPDAVKNQLCPPVPMSGNATDLLNVAYRGMVGLLARGAEPDLAAWNESCRLNPASGALSRLDDPQIAAAFSSLAGNVGAAMRNLEQRADLAI